MGGTRRALWAAGGRRWHLVGRTQPPNCPCSPTTSNSPMHTTICAHTIMHTTMCAVNRNALHTTVTPMHTWRISFSSSSSDIFKAHPIYALNRNAPKPVRLRKISNLIFLENLDNLRNEMRPEKDGMGGLYLYPTK